MAFAFAATTVTASGTTSAESVRLYHGTDEDSANWIVSNGLNWNRLTRVEGAYAFCTTRSRAIACNYALINPARGIPTCVEIALPSGTLQTLLMKDPPWVAEVLEDNGYEFLQPSFEVVTHAWTIVSVQKVADLKLTFGEQK
jgi:hypothetical protein